MSDLITYDPTATGHHPTRVTCTQTPDALMNVTVHYGDGTTSSLTQTSDRDRTRLLIDNTDHSHDPTTAIHTMLVDSDPYRLNWLLNKLAAALPADHRLPDTSGAAALVAAAHPALRQLHATTAFAPPPALPYAVAQPLSQPSIADLLRDTTGVTNRPAARQLAATATRTDQLHLREIAMLPAARGLQPDHLTAVLADPPHRPALRLLTVRAHQAQAAGHALATLPPERHRDLLASIVSDNSGHATLAKLGVAHHSGRLDLAGVSTPNHLTDRCLEAIADPEIAPTALHRLTGQPALDRPPARFRVATATSTEELRHAGQQLHNCLAQWTPGKQYAAGLTGNAAILLVIDNQGTYHAAIHVKNNQVRSMLGPNNRQLPAPVLHQLNRRLTQAGIRPQTTPTTYDDAPF